MQKMVFSQWVEKAHGGVYSVLCPSGIPMGRNAALGGLRGEEIPNRVNIRGIR